MHQRFNMAARFHLLEPSFYRTAALADTVLAYQLVAACASPPKVFGRCPCVHKCDPLTMAAGEGVHLLHPMWAIDDRIAARLEPHRLQVVKKRRNENRRCIGWRQCSATNACRRSVWPDKFRARSCNPSLRSTLIERNGKKG